MNSLESLNLIKHHDEIERITNDCDYFGNVRSMTVYFSYNTRKAIEQSIQDFLGSNAQAQLCKASNASPTVEASATNNNGEK